MPLREVEIANLKNDGKFDDSDIALFVDKSIGYNEIKKIQEKIHSRPENITKSFEEINPEVMDVIREKIALADATTQSINYLLNRYGGRRRRSKKRKSRKSKSKRRRSRRY